VPTTRWLAQKLSNALDFLEQKGLILFPNSVLEQNGIVGWHSIPGKPFTLDYQLPGINTYISLLRDWHFSAILRDGSLLQLRYAIADGGVVRHNLAYIPCPVVVNWNELQHGSIIDIVEEHLTRDDLSEVIVLRTPVRFDFAPESTAASHPATHLTINGSSCRIACVAPLHPYRFIDFVFRNFYPAQHARESAWFAVASNEHLGTRVLTEDDARGMHVSWDIHS
jgi:hypothetical protein